MSNLIREKLFKGKGETLVLGIIVTTLFFTDEDERIQRESKAVFYGQTTVLTSWGSGIGVSPLNGVVLGSGVATSTARQEEKSHSPGRLYLTSKRLLFVKDWGGRIFCEN